ncbi:hypothetical protein D3C87_1108150 [compost metagenome]
MAAPAIVRSLLASVTAPFALVTVATSEIETLVPCMRASSFVSESACWIDRLSIPATRPPFTLRTVPLSRMSTVCPCIEASSLVSAPMPSRLSPLCATRTALSRLVMVSILRSCTALPCSQAPSRLTSVLTPSMLTVPSARSVPALSMRSVTPSVAFPPAASRPVLSSVAAVISRLP